MKKFLDKFSGATALFVIFGIKVYKKHLSKHKGYQCAHGYTTGLSCSDIAINNFQNMTIPNAINEQINQHYSCTVAYKELINKKLKGYELSSNGRKLVHSQKGFVDIGVCAQGPIPPP